MSETNKYQQAIRALAEVYVEGLKEKAREMELDPGSRSPEDPPWEASMFVEQLHEMLHEGELADEVSAEVMKILAPRVRFTVEMYMDEVEALEELVISAEHDAQKNGEEETAIRFGKIWQALRAGERERVK